MTFRRCDVRKAREVQETLQVGDLLVGTLAVGGGAINPWQLGVVVALVEERWKLLGNGDERVMVMVILLY